MVHVARSGWHVSMPVMRQVSPGYTMSRAIRHPHTSSRVVVRPLSVIWLGGIAAGGDIDFIQPIEAGVAGNMGYLLGKYQATNADVTVGGWVIIAAKRTEGRWVIAVYETVVRGQPE
jgi:hypothetical protein